MAGDKTYHCGLAVAGSVQVGNTRFYLVPGNPGKQPAGGLRIEQQLELRRCGAGG